MEKTVIHIRDLLNLQWKTHLYIGWVETSFHRFTTKGGSIRSGEACYRFFFIIAAVRISASSLAKLHQRYDRGIAMARQMAWPSTYPHRGGTSWASRYSERTPPMATKTTFRREGCLVMAAHTVHRRSWATLITVQTFMFRPAELEG